MSENKICSVCGKNEATLACSECGVPLCETCAKEVILENISPGSTIKGVTTTMMRAAKDKKRVCPKCMKEVDLM